MAHRIVTLPGDGIGPEIMVPTLELLSALGDFEFEERSFGGASIDAHGIALTDETLAACKAADAVLLAAVGGPKWDTTDPHAPRPEQGLLGLRKGLGLYANLRPVRPLPALYDASPLRRERIEGTDLLVVRELTGGIYFGEKTRTADSASDLCIYTVAEIERIARIAFGAARAKVSSVDKANVLETSRLWREVVSALHAREFPHIQLEHVLVDNAAMQLVSAPRHFDTILTENMFGDILSDEAAMLTGSIGMLPSASLGGSPGVTDKGNETSAGPGLFEPVHGSAPDIAGQGIANPLAMFLSAALMLRHGLGLESEAAAVESAVDRALGDGLRTPDLGGAAGTSRGDAGGARQPQVGAAMKVDPTDLIWMNGEFVAWEDAKVHVLTHGLHYGTGVFEGVRCYDTELGPAVFRNAEHVERLLRSAELYYMPVPYAAETLRAATLELVARNGLRSCYIRPLVYRGYGSMGLNPLEAPVEVTIACWEWGTYLGEEGMRHGVRAKVSSWRRISPDSLIPHAKASGQYLNSVLAKVESSEGRLRGGDPARRPRPRLRGHRREHLHRARRRDRHARPAQLDPRRHHAPLGHPDSRRTSATRCSSATSRAPRCTSRTRSSSPAPPPSWCRYARSTTTRSAPASPARSRACCRAPSTTRSTDAPSATASGSTSSARPRCRRRRARRRTPPASRRARRRRSRPQRPADVQGRALRRHPARRHGRRRAVAHGRGEAARRARAWTSSAST